MKIFFSVIILITLLFSCKNNLTGHWHSEGIEDFEYILDIENNGKCSMIKSLDSEPVNGKHSQDEKHIDIYGQSCGIYSFYYETNGLMSNDIINIHNSLNKKIILKRRPNCTKIDDYKTKLKIDFIKLINIDKDSVCNFRHGSNEYINVGFSKDNNTILIESWRLNGLQTIKAFDSLTYKFEENYRKEIAPYINYILTLDKKVKGRDLNKILDAISKNESKNVYLRTLKDSIISTDRDIFEYVNIHLNKNRFDFDTNKSIDQIIN